MKHGDEHEHRYYYSQYEDDNIVKTPLSPGPPSPSYLLSQAYPPFRTPPPGSDTRHRPRADTLFLAGDGEDDVDHWINTGAEMVSDLDHLHLNSPVLRSPATDKSE